MEGTMKLPKGYKEIDADEMMYLDGGYRSSRRVYIPGQTRRISRSAYATNQLLGSVLISAGLAAITGGTSIFAQTVTAIGTVFFGRSGSKALAEQADRADGSYDGWVTRYISAHYRTEYNPFPPNSYQGALF